MDIELVNNKDPSSFWVKCNRSFDVPGKICFGTSCSNGWRDTFASGNFQIGNQSLDTMPDVFMFVEGNLGGFHRFGWMFSLECLNASFLICADEMNSLFIQLNGSEIQIAYNAHLFVKDFWIFLSFIGQPVMTAMWFQIGFAFKKRPACRVDMLLTMPLLTASSANSLAVHSVTGRSLSSTGSQAMAMIWQTCSAVNFAGVPLRG